MLKFKITLGFIVLLALVMAIDARPDPQKAPKDPKPPKDDASTTTEAPTTTKAPNGSPVHGSDVVSMVALVICSLIGHHHLSIQS